MEIANAEARKKQRRKEMKLGRDFYRQPTIKVSKQLLGKFLVRVEEQESGRVKIGKIVETEAYIGPDDKASHAAFGKTKRCAPMYEAPGTAYVYFIYGMYWMLNIVTEGKEKPCAVLIRALESIGSETNLLLGFVMASLPRAGSPSDSEIRKSSCVPESLGLPGETCAKVVSSPARVASGPGKLCRWMGINGSFNGEDLVKSQRLWIEDRGIKIKPDKIVASKRIGVDYAGKWKDKPWRFYIKNNLYLSRK